MPIENRIDLLNVTKIIYVSLLKYVNVLYVYTCIFIDKISRRSDVFNSKTKENLLGIYSNSVPLSKNCLDTIVLRQNYVFNHTISFTLIQL